MTNVQLKCPHCGSSNFIKNGHDKFRDQRFFRKVCKRYLNSPSPINSNSSFFLRYDFNLGMSAKSMIVKL